MPRFTPHSLERFIERRPDLYDPGDPPTKRVILSTMDRRYRRSRPVTRIEAQRIIGKPITWCYPDTLFRAEAEEDTAYPGVWVISWRQGKAEWVITYLVFGVQPEDREIDQFQDVYDPKQRGGVWVAVS